MLSLLALRCHLLNATTAKRKCLPENTLIHNKRKIWYYISCYNLMCLSMKLLFSSWLTKYSCAEVHINFEHCVINYTMLHRCIVNYVHAKFEYNLSSLKNWSYFLLSVSRIAVSCQQLSASFITKITQLACLVALNSNLIFMLLYKASTISTLQIYKNFV